VALKGGKELQARLAAVGKLPGRELSRQWAEESTRLALANVRRRTGATARTIRIERVTDTGASIAVAGASKFLEGGVPPHPIEGKPGLSFKARSGRTIFVKRAAHPGMRPKRFWRNSYRKVFREQKRIDKLVEKWNRAA
jgi:hypothetical protein